MSPPKWGANVANRLGEGPRVTGILVAHITNRDDVHHRWRARNARSSSQYRVLTLLLRPESIWRSTLRSIISWLGGAAGAVLANASY
jgi:hypothetical protein